MRKYIYIYNMIYMIYMNGFPLRRWHIASHAHHMDIRLHWIVHYDYVICLSNPLRFFKKRRLVEVILSDLLGRCPAELAQAAEARQRGWDFERSQVLGGSGKVAFRPLG